MNDTPQRLINAATSLFADNGFDGASVRDITAAAEANLGAVTYHFGSKQGLYEAVLDTAFRPVRDQLAGTGPTATGVRGLDRVEAIIRLLFAHIASHPHLQLLILRQIVHSHELAGSAGRTLGQILEEMTAAIRDGQADGTVRPGDAVLMAVSAMSQPAYFSLIRRLLPDRLAKARGRGFTTGELTDHAVRFVRAGLAAGKEDS